MDFIDRLEEQGEIFVIRFKFVIMEKLMNLTKYSDFKAKRVTRSYCQTINAEPFKIHSLICPVKEAEWLDGWDYSLIYSRSGFAEEGCVFISRNEGEKDTIWLITKRNDEKFETEFVRITPESRIAKLNINIKDGGNYISYVHITYTFTALTEEGNKFMESFTEDNFIKDMEFWEASMNHYLETGKPLPNPDRNNWLRYESDSEE